jgi:cell division protein FtsW
MAEPDLGTVLIIITTGFTLVFSAGVPLISLLKLGLTGIISVIGLIFSSPYRKQRLLSFINTEHDPLGASYQIRQVLIALGSGHFWGVGLGQSRQKYLFLPEVATDSIFAIIGEEIGFIGSLAIVLIFAFIVLRGLSIAKKAPDSFSQLLAGGIVAWIGFQTIINLGSMVALLPLTGVPLPFISYGGTSLLLTMAACGILMNISRYQIIKK